MTKSLEIAIFPSMTLPPNHSGLLIAFEGIDGAGKTTQANRLQSYLNSKGIQVLLTKEPTNGKWGQVLRDSAVTGRLSLQEEVETFIKDRKEHVETKLLPALEKGFVVIVDRYYFSTAAYQGARGLDPAELIEKNEFFAPEPDLLILLDVDTRIGLGRIKSRGDTANHFEKAETLDRAREIFLGLKKPYLLRLDANLPLEKITELIISKIEMLLSKKDISGKVKSV
ncbi:MAG TPA: dTMP kinase [Verrucomicrobiae bacterium]